MRRSEICLTFFAAGLARADDADRFFGMMEVPHRSKGDITVYTLIGSRDQDARKVRDTAKDYRRGAEFVEKVKGFNTEDTEKIGEHRENGRDPAPLPRDQDDESKKEHRQDSLCHQSNNKEPAGRRRYGNRARLRRAGVGWGGVVRCAGDGHYCCCW